MKKIGLYFLLVFIVSFSFSAKAQEKYNIDKLNYYKYVVIPIQYKFQDEDNEYMLNSLTKYLLNQEGFDTYMDVESKPNDLKFNRCLALYVDVISESESFFSLQTKLDLVFKDCNNEVIFKSEGKSRIKNYEESYKDALKEAFEVFGSANFIYKYNGKNNYDQTHSVKAEQSEPEINEITQVDKIEYNLPGTYSLFNEKYKIDKIEAGYIMLSAESGDRKAFINVTSDHSILFNSEKMNGKMKFTNDGNLEIEYFNNDTGKLEKATLYKVE